MSVNTMVMTMVIGLGLVTGAVAAEQGAGSIAKDRIGDSLDGYNVVWDTPSADSAGSMPLGNGEIALNAWVESSGDLLFYIARTDAWSGALDGPDFGAYGLIKVGRKDVVTGAE